MVRPGFYLGRAYINRAFILNFTLLNEEVARRSRRRSLPAAMSARTVGRTPSRSLPRPASGAWAVIVRSPAGLW